MYHINIDLEDWEWAALADMAREREIGTAAMARKLLQYGLQKRVGQVFDTLVLAGTANEMPPFDEEAIEHRLGRLFEE
jgi:hypothetical protein